MSEDGVRSLSLRNRFLVAPLLGLLLFGLLTAGLVYELRYQSALFTRSDAALSEYDRLLDVFVELQEHHLALYELLYAGSEISEETLYDRAKERLNALDKSVRGLEAMLPRTAHRADTASAAKHEALLGDIAAYRKAATSAVEMTTVNLALAPAQFAHANKRFSAMSRSYEEFLDLERDAVRAETAGAVEHADGAVRTFGGYAVVVAVVLVVLSLMLSRFLSRELGHQISALGEIARQAGARFQPEGTDEVQRITHAIEMFRKSLQHLRTYSEVVRCTGEAVAVLDLDGTIIEVNPAYASSVGRSREELIGSTMLASGFSADVDETSGKLWPTLRRNGSWTGELLGRRSNGASFPVWASFNTVLDDDGKRVYYVCVLRDVSALKQSEQQLRQLAFYDTLTHLPNRALFNDRLAMAIAQAHRLATKVAVIYLDVDRFKLINDGFGHSFGDVLLKLVAARIKGAVRETDTVARLGGDEFVIMLPDVASEADAEDVATKLLATFGQALVVEGRELRVTASVGMSVYPEHGEDADTLLKHADAAMYCAKDAGRDELRVYTREMGAEVAERVELESALSQALDRGEFELHYQPKVDLTNGNVRGVEALIRWRRTGTTTLVAPNRFIPIAEENGLIVPIGEWALRTACAQAKAWRDAGHGDLSVAVNLSARQFRQQNLAQVVRDVLAKTGLPPQALELELTESLLMQDSESFVDTLKALKAIGVTLSLDDFGTGYSSLSYLNRFPIDIIKIDRSFIRNVTSSSDDASLVKAILALARSLDLRTVAEGVETEGQLGFLGANRCDAIQGYLFSRPLAVDAMTTLLVQGRQMPVPQSSRESERRVLLFVDDSELDLKLLNRQFDHQGYELLSASNARHALELLATHPIGVMICDARMTEMSGVALLSRVRELYPEVGRIMLSAYDLESVHAAINEGGVQNFFTKPCDVTVLRSAVAAAFREYEARRPEARPERALDAA